MNVFCKNGSSLRSTITSFLAVGRCRPEDSLEPMRRWRHSTATASRVSRVERIALRRAFSTHDTSSSSNSRPRRLQSVRVGDDDDAFFSSPMGLAAAKSAVSPDDPYAHVQIFRKDMLNDSGNSKMPLSIDVPMRKFLDMFNDYDGKRCKLCNETYTVWHSHSSIIPHTGREGVLTELVRAYCGTPEEIVKMWWYRLNHSTAFNRIPSLSHDNSHKRKRRLQFLLKFLKERGVLRVCFNVSQGLAGAGRSWEFERLEWVGDNVVKYLFNNRWNVLFPVHEGGIRGRLGHSQFMIDGNDGLARAYDYLEFQKLTMSDKVVSKFKSDVMETIFGELQLYLWSSQVDEGTENFELPFTPEMVPLRALVNHVMEELAHVMLMYHVESALAALQRIVRENQLQYVRADPSLRGNAEMQSEFASGIYARQKNTVQSAKLSAVKTTAQVQSSSGSHHHGNHSHHRDESASLYYAATNYDAFRKVQALGGLLPRCFARKELGVTPLFMPHLQEDAALMARVERNWAGTVAADVISELPQVERDAAATSKNGANDPLCLQPKPTDGSTKTVRPHLSVLDLKDSMLVPELL